MRRSHRAGRHPVNGLAEHFGCDVKLILAKVRKLIRQGYLDHGVSIWTSWVTPEGAALVKEFTGA